MIEFKDFGIEDNARYLEYLRRCMQIPASASPFITLSYKEMMGVTRGYADGLCWHKSNVDDTELWAPPAGDWDEIDWRKVFAENVPDGTTFAYVPEYLVNLWQQQLGAAIEAEPDRDNWDYILHLDRMEKMTGNKLKAFRRYRNIFEKTYDYTIEEITPKIFDELRKFQSAAEENLQQRANRIEDAQDDDVTFRFALEHWDELKNLFGFVVRVDGEIVAYVLDEQIDETNAIGLFAKANYDIKGANQFAYWYDAKINLERGILVENIMADTGEENLRFFKEHLYPLVMLKKFFVTYNAAGTKELPKIETREDHELKFSFERLGKNLTVKLSGKLNTDSANGSGKNILAALDGAEAIVFDLDGLKYISSSGLKVLVAAMKKIKAKGGTLTVKNVGEQVHEVLTMTGFAKILGMEG